MVREHLARLPERVERARQQDYDGLAIFLSVSPPLDREIRLRFPVENQALVGRDPFLRHLLVYDEEYERSLAVVLRDEIAQVVGYSICEPFIATNEQIGFEISLVQ